MVNAYFDDIRKQILSEIDLAEESIIVAVYWFTNHDLFDKLIKSVKRKINVELIIHNDYINNRDSGLNFQQFINDGGKFYFSSTINPMHNKFCVIDNKCLINGSYNWTYYAENKNSENILIIKEEKDVINAFINEFNRLKDIYEPVEIIKNLSKFEVDEVNNLSSRDYLANDIVYQAKATGNKDILEQAFKIAPLNIEVQKKAFEYDLTIKRKLKYSIGSSLKDDKYLIIVPKDTIIPVTTSEEVVTSADNQKTCEATIHFGESPIASENRSIAKMKLNGLPPKPAGDARMRYNFTIDLYGTLRMEKYSLDNGVRDFVEKNINELLEEIEKSK